MRATAAAATAIATATAMWTDDIHRAIIILIPRTIVIPPQTETTRKKRKTMVMMTMMAKEEEEEEEGAPQPPSITERPLHSLMKYCRIILLLGILCLLPHRPPTHPLRRLLLLRFLLLLDDNNNNNNNVYDKDRRILLLRLLLVVFPPPPHPLPLLNVVAADRTKNYSWISVVAAAAVQEEGIRRRVHISIRIRIKAKAMVAGWCNDSRIYVGAVVVAAVIFDGVALDRKLDNANKQTKVQKG